MDGIHAESVEEQMISLRRPDRRSAYSVTAFWEDSEMKSSPNESL
jgi:hypothetical protein